MLYKGFSPMIVFFFKLSTKEIITNNWCKIVMQLTYIHNIIHMYFRVWVCTYPAWALWPLPWTGRTFFSKLHLKKRFYYIKQYNFTTEFWLVTWSHSRKIRKLILLFILQAPGSLQPVPPWQSGCYHQKCRPHRCGGTAHDCALLDTPRGRP